MGQEKNKKKREHMPPPSFLGSPLIEEASPYNEVN